MIQSQALQQAIGNEARDKPMNCVERAAILDPNTGKCVTSKKRR